MKINNGFEHNKPFRQLVLLLAIFVAIPAHGADDKTITSQPADDEFGRLFTSQYERNAIDRARLTGGFIPAKVTGVDENSTTATDSPPPVQPIKVLGVLLRADGKNKVWLSGVTETPQNILNGRSIIGNINQSANVKVGVNNGAILKPGQVWSPLTGRQESYQIPVPKPVVDASVASKEKPKKPITPAASSSIQASSVSSSEVSSSVQSSAK